MGGLLNVTRIVTRCCHRSKSGAFFGVSALVLAIMWIIYIVEMLTSPWV
jgi:hypothetical protein